MSISWQSWIGCCLRVTSSIRYVFSDTLWKGVGRVSSSKDGGKNKRDREIIRVTWKGFGHLLGHNTDF
jgi:hypothetical protein